MTRLELKAASRATFDLCVKQRWGLASETTLPQRKELTYKRAYTLPNRHAPLSTGRQTREQT